ncbi:cation:proton antiporter [Palleronia caenipelagi]|uniref:Monovalent cation/H(+) antiporter subunit G n=1 Tax=Palleronia caenipelagi TaxID=2489174 RepID=A0A547Q8E1_9RHOB|nr:monovalent cation/H(+) antiporter subunit G [Palleronia caenipelagi]TRD22623.1 monovalent cation/H(+) antiporter subunit G [Palleronia caenipelagi]
MIDTLLQFAAVTCLAIGAFFTLVGAIGLLKFDTPMKRLHAPTMVSTLGVGAFLVASIIDSFATGSGSLREILIMAFLFVTAPISANFIAKVHMHRADCNRPPRPGSRIWATYDTDEADQPAEEAA